jgi:hypothetical protein
MMFDGGPPLKLQSLLGLVGPDRPNVARRMALVALLCWLPLAALAAFEGNLLGSTASGAFLADYAVHARYLLAAPLLILAEVVCLPRMGALARSFLESGLVAEADVGRYEEAAASTRRLLDSGLVEVLAILAAYLIVFVLYRNLDPAVIPQWQRQGAATHISSLAGWWGLLVSLPILLTLQLGWLWRLVLWTRFLWRMSRLPLQLVPSHPDGAAGLRFVGYSAQTFSTLGFALGVIAAGSIANAVSGGAPLAAYKYAIGGLVAGVVVVLNAPLLVFFSMLLAEWKRGAFEYGRLADAFGREFEAKWFRRRERVDPNVLGLQDFSAATDLYQVVDRVYAMWYLPIHLRSTALLAIATLLPFVPVALMALPFDEIVNDLAGLLF